MEQQYGEHIGILKNRVDSIQESLQKLTEISRDMKELVVVQQAKLEEREKNELRLEAALERENNVVHKRLSVMDKSIRDEIDDRHEALVVMLAEIKREQKEHHQLMSQNLKEIRDEFKKDFDNADVRLAALEKWRWIIVGGMFVVIFLFNLAPFFTKILAIT